MILEILGLIWIFYPGEWKEFRFKKDHCYIKGKDVFYGPGARQKFLKEF